MHSQFFSIYRPGGHLGFCAVTFFPMTGFRWIFHGVLRVLSFWICVKISLVPIFSGSNPKSTRLIVDWNQLDEATVASESLDTFKRHLY